MGVKQSCRSLYKTRVVRGLQEEVEACDKAGSSDATISPDEDLESFGRLLASVSSKEEMDRLVKGVINS